MFHSKVVGTTFAGAGQPDYPWHELYGRPVVDLVAEPENPHDPMAIKVELQGRKLGYIPRETARIIHDEVIRLGRWPSCVVTDVTGGEQDGKGNRGINLFLDFGDVVTDKTHARHDDLPAKEPPPPVSNVLAVAALDDNLAHLPFRLLATLVYDKPLTTQEISKRFDANPLIVNRWLSKLLEAGYVERTSKGTFAPRSA